MATVTLERDVLFQDYFALLKQHRFHLSLIGSVACVAAVAVLFHLKNFHGLVFMDAMDSAQVGRNLSQGHGFATDFIRPLSLTVTRKRAIMPDLVNAPLYPFILGWLFPVFGARDVVVSSLSMAIHLASAVLLFLLVYRLSRELLTASVTVLTYGLSRPVLMMADSGRPIILAGCLLLAMLLALTPADPDSEATDKTLAKQYTLAGALAGLCCLADYIALLYAIPLALFWGLGQQRWSPRTVVAFAAGFALVVLPWCVRNARVVGNPFFTLQWFELTMYTDWFPGLSLYREVQAAPLSPAAFLIYGAAPFAVKIFRGLGAYYVEAPQVPHLYLMPFILLAYWIWSGTHMARRVKAGVLASLLIYMTGLMAVGRNSQYVLLPLAPLLCYLGISVYLPMANGLLTRWIEDRGLDDEPVFFRGFAMSPQTVRTCAVLGLLLVLAFPLVNQSFFQQTQAQDSIGKVVRQACRIIPDNAMVVTDIPWAVAWYGNHRAIWIPNQVHELDALDKTMRIGAVYLSPMTPSYPNEEAIGQWQDTYRQGRDLPGYVKAIRPSTSDIVYLREPSRQQ